MAKVCLKCNYERKPSELAPETECPQCGAIYAKVEKALRPPEVDPQNSPPEAPPNTPPQEMDSQKQQPSEQKMDSIS